jgi:hypothetical protein
VGHGFLEPAVHLLGAGAAAARDPAPQEPGADGGLPLLGRRDHPRRLLRAARRDPRAQRPSDDPWIALALHTPATAYLTVWRRPGSEATTTFPLPERAGSAARVELLYPAARQAVAVWNANTADLTVTLPTAPSAALLRITRTEPDAL